MSFSPTDIASDKMNRKDDSDVSVAFSHVHLYVDEVEDVQVYKTLEQKLNVFASRASHLQMDIAACRELWSSIEAKNNDNGDDNHDVEGQEGRNSIQAKHAATNDDSYFEPQNRDVVKQLLAGFGFRVMAIRMPLVVTNGENCTQTNTRSVLVTSRDPNGVQIVVTAIEHEMEKKVNVDEYLHFDAENLHRFFKSHANRQGIAVLAFEVTSGSIDTIFYRYKEKHPKLVSDHGLRQYTSDEGQTTKILEVYAYYKGEKGVSDADVGTVLRFVEREKKNIDDVQHCILPGLMEVDATFDDTSQAAYCDHWVSNVVSRTGFIDTLEETLGFTPKVDFNAGVVAAGEAQIESTVTGNETTVVTKDKESALKDQSQVYLPINNALSSVGHVHGFLKEIGQGIQHVASRVDNLIKFVQRGNDYRKITGEGFTFLRIPRSYYGVLTTKQLVNGIHPPNPNSFSHIDETPVTVLSQDCAQAIMDTCEQFNVISHEGAVDLDSSADEIGNILDANMKGSHREEYLKRREEVLEIIMRSRYTNLWALLRHHLTEESYLGIVRNQILVDVQGDDLLFQIFTSNILQRKSGDEAPFFEFIQRVCSECIGPDGCPAKLKPGCGGFGIRNFLTLFLSIEVSKAMLEVARAKTEGDEERMSFAQQMVDIFTDQLNESNPILTEISDAMTEEGTSKDELNAALERGDEEAANRWQSKMTAAGQAKLAGNEKLMACSSKYKALMKTVRENHEKVH